uniref:ACB domain-containing protein n=1 Tax=Amphilophus citrinellus TaxID=61819 RepID=A0A3Q0RL42_AMPCI
SPPGGELDQVAGEDAGKTWRSYRPSYEVMLRFYSLYKQAVCGPCTVPRPGFWDPVGRYKWWVCI